jgi:hypothetical protein
MYNRQEGSTLDYFKQGLFLIKRYPVVFIVSFFFYIITDIFYLLGPYPFLQTILDGVSVFLTLVSVGYIFSIPKLIDLARAEKLNLHTGLAAVKDIAVRIFPAAVIGFILFSIPFILILVPYALDLTSLITEGKALPTELPLTYQMAISFVSIPISAIFGLLFFTFTPIVYSLESLTIKDSLRKNIFFLKEYVNGLLKCPIFGHLNCPSFLTNKTRLIRK